MKTALIAGPTGLIGKQVLEMLLASDQYERVVAYTRKALTPHTKLQQLQFSGGTMDGLTDPTLRVDDVFCCLGTTMGKAKSKEKFYQVDFHYPVELGKIGAAHGAQRYLLVSALGAKKDSKIYYNRVKGEVEEAISKLGFPAVHIFRPSLLLGSREETRSGEDAAKFFYSLFGFLIPKKYKGIDSAKVARAMVHYASTSNKGVFIHESVDLQDH